jgi:hypothetical protein
MSFLAALGTGLSLAIRYAPLVISVATKMFDLINQVRKDSNPILDLTTTTQDNIAHLNDICGRVQSLLQTSLPPLPAVTSAQDLPGYFLVVSQYAQAYQAWADQSVAVPAIAVRAALPASSDDFVGDENRAGGINSVAASALTGAPLAAFQSLQSALTSWANAFPQVTMESSQLVPAYDTSEEYLIGAYNVLQRNAFAGFIEAAVSGIREIAVGSPIVPIDGYTIASRYTWDLGTEGYAGTIGFYIGTGLGSGVTFNSPSGQMMWLFDGTLPSSAIFDVPNEVNYDTVFALYNVGATPAYYAGQGPAVPPTNTSAQVTLNLNTPTPGVPFNWPPKFGLYHWIFAVKFTVTLVAAAAPNGLAIRFGGNPTDALPTQNYDAKYWVPLTFNVANGNCVVELAIDCIEVYQNLITSSKFIGVCPTFPVDTSIVPGGKIQVLMEPLNVYGVITRTGLLASDVSYQNAQSEMVGITNDTTWIDVLGKCSLDDDHGDPNASVQALFYSRFASTAQAFAQAIASYAKYCAGAGVNPDSVYMAIAGVPLSTFADLQAWLSASGPFAGLNTQQTRLVLYKILYDLYTFSSYAQGSSGLSATVVELAEQVPTQ